VLAMLGLGLRWTISSFNSACRSESVRSTLRRDSVSRVSSSRERERGFPVRLGLGFLMDLDAVWGRRALARPGDVLMGSSSGAGEGEAFRFLEDEDVGTGQELCVSSLLQEHRQEQAASDNVLARDGESRVCSWKCGGTGGVARLFMMGQSLG